MAAPDRANDPRRVANAEVAQSVAGVDDQNPASRMPVKRDVAKKATPARPKTAQDKVAAVKNIREQAKKAKGSGKPVDRRTGLHNSAKTKRAKMIRSVFPGIPEHGPLTKGQPFDAYPGKTRNINTKYETRAERGEEKPSGFTPPKVKKTAYNSTNAGKANANRKNNSARQVKAAEAREDKAAKDLSIVRATGKSKKTVNKVMSRLSKSAATRSQHNEDKVKANSRPANVLNKGKKK